MQGRPRVTQGHMHNVKQGLGTQVRGQLDDQDSQNLENAVKYGTTAERRMQGRSRVAQGPMHNVKRDAGAQVCS